MLAMQLVFQENSPVMAFDPKKIQEMTDGLLIGQRKMFKVFRIDQSEFKGDPVGNLEDIEDHFGGDEDAGMYTHAYIKITATEVDNARTVVVDSFLPFDNHWNVTCTVPSEETATVEDAVNRVLEDILAFGLI